MTKHMYNIYNMLLHKYHKL